MAVRSVGMVDPAEYMNKKLGSGQRRQRAEAATARTSDGGKDDLRSTGPNS